MKYTRQLILLAVLLSLVGINYGQQTSNGSVYRILLPGKSWAVDFSSSDFQEFDERIEDKRYWLTASLRDAKLHKHLLSVSMQTEQAGNTGDATSFRDVIEHRLSKYSSSAIQSVKKFEHNSIPVLRYSANWLASLRNEPQSSQLPGGPFIHVPDSSTSKTLEAFFARDDMWISVELTFSDIDKNDEYYFFSFVDSIRFCETSNPITSFDYYHKGKSFYMQDDFKRAIGPFEKSLALEQQYQSLDSVHLRQLIREMADVYGTEGKLEEYKRILDYGVERDPSYYVFHWGLARYFGSKGDVDNALQSLEKTFASCPKPKLISQCGSKLANVFADPAFAKLSANETFRMSVIGMQKKWK
jgi:tetratricopeptide (TPR) repeat protein